MGCHGLDILCVGYEVIVDAFGTANPNSSMSGCRAANISTKPWFLHSRAVLDVPMSRFSLKSPTRMMDYPLD